MQLQAGRARVEVDAEQGARLASLRVDGLELLVAPASRPGAVDPMSWGCFPMAPFAGRLRGGRLHWAGRVHELPQNLGGHAAHGTVFDRPWSVEHQDADYCRLRTDLGERWPWEGMVVQEVALRRDRLELRLEVHSRHDPFPATCGWHPWFRRRLDRGRPLRLHLRARRWYPRGDDGLPLGTLAPAPRIGPFDDCFTAIRWPAELRWPGALSVRLDSTCTHAVRYDVPAHAVCVEPQTGPPDAANLQRATIVRPGQPLVAETSLIWL